VRPTEQFLLIIDEDDNLSCAARGVLEGQVECIGTISLEELTVRIVILVRNSILSHDDIIYNVGRIEGREAAAISHTNAGRHLRLHYILFVRSSTATHSSNLAPRIVSKVSATFTVLT